MRILRITLKNLASLSGEHTVDFTAEPLRSAGLFALIGPTGSGKSTLLDAMCLALYDKTPRLKQAPGSGEQVDGISQQDSRSLLRRGARDGFAEVAFVSTDGQTFTSRWSVHRAGQKKQVAGKLQPVEMVLLRGDVRGGTDAEQVCGGRKTLVLEAIEERIGLKFEQFTRAVLLAQNEFATFLRSKDDERMEILEALTATQKYRRISQGVYQRAKKESDRIRDLETRCEGQVPLSETERAEKETERQRAKEKLTQTTGTLETLQALKRWHQDHSECTDSLELAKAKHAEAAQNIAAAETRQSRLRRIEHAQREATVKYQDRQSAQQRREKLDTDVSAAAEQLSLARQSLNAAIAAEETAQRQQTELIESQTSAQQKLQSAIAFQPQVQPAEQAAKAAEDRLKSATKRRNEQANRLRECEQAIAAGKKTREDITQQLLPLESLQPFAADSSLWISRLLTLETAARDETASRKHDAECSAALAAARLEHDNYQTASRQLQAELNQHHQQLTELEARIRGLNGEQLRQTERSLSARQRYLERLKSQLEQRTQLEQTLEARQQELADEQQKQQADEQQIADLKTQESAAAEERRIADLAVTYLNNTFDDHAKRLRATLEPGQKCPVCGATEHPFQNTPADLELSVLQIAREKFREKTEAHEKLKGRLQKLKTAVEQRTPRVQSLSAEIERKKRDRGRFQFDNTDQLVVAEILALPADDHQQRTATAMAETAQSLNAIEEQLKQLTKLEQQRTEDLERRDSLQQECNTRSLLESQLSEAVGAASSKEQANAALLDERIRKRSAAEQQLEQFHAALPNTRQEFDADPAGFRYRLNERLTLLLRLQKELKETEQQLEQLESQRPQLETDKQAAEKEFQERKQEQERATEELTRLQQQLRDLLEDRSIEQFQRELEDQQKSAQTQVDSARETKSQANLAEARAQSQHQSLHKQLTQAQQAEKSATDLLHRWLADFSPGLNLDDALVELQELMGYDSAWIDAEQADLKKLDREVQEAAGKIQSCKERLENHRQRRTDERDEAAIEAALEAQQETVKSSSEELQDVERALKNDDETRGRNTAIQAEIEAAKAKAQPWFDLDQLIGSADGKKFTLMAQRFTLDRLLQHANVQLRELARRYRLERLGESLNLAVIDQDLGDERRSVHSLSGGETFLVSLALALGLASLTSSRLRIESLFIDEGFGSLDEDTLEVAMNALNHLQSQGRKVGVITHVERMQDAITTQIQVRRGPGGASRIVLPQSDGRGDSEAVTQ